MNIGEKIIALNAAFQKVYYDNEDNFFLDRGTVMLNEIATFLEYVLQNNKHLDPQLKNHIDQIREQVEEFNSELLDLKKDDIKDSYLNIAKRSISQGCWRFYWNMEMSNSEVLRKIAM